MLPSPGAEALCTGGSLRRLPAGRLSSAVAREPLKGVWQAVSIRDAHQAHVLTAQDYSREHCSNSACPLFCLTHHPPQYDSVTSSHSRKELFDAGSRLAHKESALRPVWRTAGNRYWLGRY